MRTPILLVTLLVGCGGGSDLDPGAGDDPGTGTSTLLVSGSVMARPRFANAQASADFDTHVGVRVRLNDATVTTGTLTVTSASGTFALAYRSDSDEWHATIPGYDEVYVLDVESGANNVLGVRVDGPGLHHFTAPTAGATLDSTMPVTVTWDRDDSADIASIETDEVGRIAIADTGEHVLAAGALKADADEPTDNELELRRANRVTPAGAVAGSDLEVGVENWIQVVVAANPAL